MVRGSKSRQRLRRSRHKLKLRRNHVRRLNIVAGVKGPEKTVLNKRIFFLTMLKEKGRLITLYDRKIGHLSICLNGGLGKFKCEMPVGEC